MTLINRAGIKEDLRREMIYNATSGRTRSVRELTHKEMDAICASLQEKAAATGLDIEMRKKRSIVLTIATRTGIKEPDSWSKFNLWMKNKSIFKKELHAYDYEELDQLIRQFRGIEANFDRSAKKVGTKAWHHATGIPNINNN